jgi:hypothetical protein
MLSLSQEQIAKVESLVNELGISSFSKDCKVGRFFFKVCWKNQLSTSGRIIKEFTLFPTQSWATAIYQNGTYREFPAGDQAFIRQVNNEYEWCKLYQSKTVID